MGKAIQASQLSGRRFGFNIAGDEPTVDEQRKIDAYIRQNDITFAQEYEKQFGVSATPGEGEGIANRAGEVFKGVGRGAVNLLESAGLGALSILDEEAELAGREYVRGAADSLRSGIQPDIGLEDTVEGKFGEALGSFVPLAGTAFIPGVGIPIAGSLAMGAGAGEASERAREYGATQEERNIATRYGALVGASELIPIKLGKLNKILQGSGIQKRAGRILEQAGYEGLQEAGANIVQNLIERGYNPDQEFGEGTLEAAGYGGGVGGFVQLVTDLIAPKRFGRGRDFERFQAEQEAAQAAEQARRAAEEAAGQTTEQKDQETLNKTKAPLKNTKSLDEKNQQQGEVEGIYDAKGNFIPADEFVSYKDYDGVEEGGVDDAFTELTEEEAFELAAADAEERRRERDGTSTATDVGRGDVRDDPTGTGAFDGSALAVRGDDTDLFGNPAVDESDSLIEDFDGFSDAQREQEEINKERVEANKKRKEEQKKKEEEQKKKEEKPKETLSTFTTSRGSVYQHHPDATTTRNRAKRGDAEVSGPQPTSNKTIFMSRDAVNRIGGIFQNTEVPVEFVPAGKNKAKLVFSEDYGPKKKGSDASEVVDFSTTPEVGLYPVEIMQRKNTNSRNIHFGNEIVEITPTSTSTQGELFDGLSTDKRGAVRDTQGPRINVPNRGFQTTLPLQEEGEGPRGLYFKRTGDEVLDREINTQNSAFSDVEARYIRDFIDTDPEIAPLFKKSTPKKEKRRLVGLRASRIRDLYGSGVLRMGQPIPPVEYTGGQEAVATPTDTDTDVNVQGDIIPAIPTMEALDGLDLPKGTIPYQLAKKELVENLEAGNREKVSETIDKIFDSLKNYGAAKASGKDKVANALVRARVAEYAAKASPKELPEEARQRRAETAIARNRIKDDIALAARLQDPVSGEVQDIIAEKIAADEGFFDYTANKASNLQRSIQGKERKARAEERRQDEAELRGMKLDDVLQEDMAKIGADRDTLAIQRVQDLGVTYSDKSEQAKRKRDLERQQQQRLIREIGFQRWVLDNIKVPDSRTGGERYVRSVREIRPEKLTQALAQYMDKVESEVVNKITTGTRLTPKEARKGLGFRRWLHHTHGIKGANDLDTLVGNPEGEAYLDKIALDFAANPKLYTSPFALPASEVVDLDRPLSPTIMQMLEDNNLQDALREYAKNAPNPNIARMAKALSRLVGNTRVTFANLGNQLTGAFDPRTNVIVLNQDLPSTGHTLLHEMLHAATAAAIQDRPGAGPVKALESIFREVQENLPSYYGSTSLVEFVAEAFSNPEFQQQLGRLELKKRYGSLKDQVTRTLARLVRFVLGVNAGKLVDKRIDQTAFNELESLIDSLLSPAPQFRDADIMFNIANRPEVANDFLNQALMNGPTFTDKSPQLVRDFLNSTAASTSTLGSTARNIVLGATPLHYLIRIAQKYFPDSKTNNLLTRLNDAMNAAAGRMAEDYDRIQAVNDRLIKWSNSDPEKMKLLNGLITQSTLYEVDPDIDERTAQERYADDAVSMQIYNRMREEFVSPMGGLQSEGMKMYRLARNMFRGIKSDLKDALDKKLEAAGVPDTERFNMLRDFFNKLEKEGSIDPYFPLNRGDGEFWISFNAIDDKTGRVEYFADNFTTDQERQRVLREIYPELVNNMMKSDEGKARIASKRTELGPEAANMSDSAVAELVVGLEQKIGVQNLNFQKIPSTSFLNQVMRTLIERTRNLSGAALEFEQAKIQEVGELVLNALPETSYLQSFRGRKQGEIAKGVVPVSFDAISTIADRSRSITRQMVQMEYDGVFGKISNELSEYYMQNSDNSLAMRDTYLKLKQYADKGAFPAVSSLSRFGTGLAFNMTLGFNVSGALVNLSQVPLIALPYLGGKYKNSAGLPAYGKVMGAMKEAMSLMKQQGVAYSERTINTFTDRLDADGNPVMEPRKVRSSMSMMNIDFDNMDPSDPRYIYKELVEEGIRNGQFKRSVDYEILDIDRMDSFWAKANRLSGFFLFHGERVNREVSMGAAYKLGVDKFRKDNNREPTSEEKSALAVEAINDTEMMNGGLSAGAAPQLAQSGLGRVVFMYKRYGVSMLSLLHNLAFGENGALRKLNENLPPEQAREMRRIARYQLAGIYGSAGVLSGVAGMPLYGAISMLFNTLFDDDDDPMDDFDTIVRTNLTEGPYKGLLNYATGLNFAGRIGLSELLFRDTFVRQDNPFLYRQLEIFGGPLVGIFSQTERGLKLFNEGEFQRGFESMAPASIKNGMKAFRYFDEGVKNVNGDTVIEDLHPAHAFLQAFGFAPAEYSRQLEVNSVLKGADRATMKRRGLLLTQYYRALVESEPVDRILARMQKYNEDHPEYPITRDTLQRSMRTRISNRAKRYHGVTFTPRLDAMYRQYADEFDKGSSLYM